MDDTLNLPMQIPADVNDRRDLTPADLVELARKIASNINELSTVLLEMRISSDQYERIRAIPFFANALEAECKEWQGVKRTGDRMQLEARVTLENAMATIGNRMLDTKEPFAAVVQAGRLLADIGGLSKPEGAGTAGEKFQINIILDADTKITKDVTPAVANPSGETVRPLLQGERTPPPEPQDPKGT